MLGLVCRAEQMICDLAIDDGAVVVVELGLSCMRRDQQAVIIDEFWERVSSHLPPLAIGAVKHLDQLRVVEVERVGPNSHNRAILLMKFLDAKVVVARPYDTETPEVRPTWVAPTCMSAPYYYLHTIFIMLREGRVVRSLPASAGPGYFLRGEAR